MFKKKSLLMFVIAIIISFIQIQFKENNTYAAYAQYEICDGYKYELASNGGIRILEYYGNDEELIIPDWINGYNVVEIGDGAFEDNEAIKSVAIPVLVTRIGKNAFESCTNLEEVKLDFCSINYIGASAFKNCYKLKSIDLGLLNITNLYSSTFESCTSLEEIYFPRSLSYIDSTALLHTNNLKKIYADLESDYFYSDTYTGILYNVDKTAIVKVPPKGNIDDFKIPNKVTKLGDNSFADCNIKNIDISENIKSIGYAFDNCSALQNINVDKNNPYYSSEDGILYNKNKTHLMTCPKGKGGTVIVSDECTVIDDMSFEKCSNITNVVLSREVVAIGRGAFENCTNLKSIRIPKSVIDMPSEGLFTGCNKLTIYCENNSLAHEYAINNKIPYVLDYEIIANSDTSIRNMKIGSSAKLNVALYSSGVINEKQGKFTFSFTNPEIVSYSNVVSNSKGTTITLKANKIGTTMLAITDVATGEKAYTNITVMNKNIIIKNEIPINYDCGEDYNFYIAGMYITDFEKISKNSTTDIIKMTIYNEKAIYGFVDVYDSKNNLKHTKMIDKFDGGNLTGIKNTIESTVYLVQDIYTNDLLSFKNRNYSKETKVEVEVPKNGYIKIGNNCIESDSCLTYNAVDLLSFAILDAISLSKVDSTKNLEKEFSENVLEKINDYGKDKFIENLKKLLVKKLTLDNTVQLSEELICTMITICKENKIDFGKILTEVTLEVGYDLEEEVFKKASGIAGVGLDGMFKMGKYANFLTQLVATYKSVEGDVLQINVKDLGKVINSSGVKLSTNKYIYDGKNKTPTVKVKYDNKVLKKNVDYKVTYKNNTKIGMATVIVSGIGIYKGNVKKTFKIVPARVEKLNQVKSYATTSIMMSWKKCNNVTGYEVYRATDRNGKYKKVKTTTKTTYKQGSLNKGKIYYYKVRTYKKVKDEKYYSDFSSVKAMATKPKEPSIKLAVEKNKAKVTWKKIVGISGYEVYMSTKKNSGYIKISNISASNTSYLKSNFISKGIYYFKMKSFIKVGNDKIYSSWSNVKSVKVR